MRSGRMKNSAADCLITGMQYTSDAEAHLFLGNYLHLGCVRVF